MKIRIGCYRKTKGGSDDPNAKVVQIGPIKIWFSYTTPVAFEIAGRQTGIVSQNEWSNATGKHLNKIDGGSERKKYRIPHEEMLRQMNAACERFFFPADLTNDCPPEILADWLEEKGLEKAAQAVRKKEVKPS